MKIDYQNNDYDFLLEFKGVSEALPLIEKAVQNGFFRAVSENRPLEELKGLLSAEEIEAELLLSILENSGLVLRGKDYIVNAPVAERYLREDIVLSAAKEEAFIGERLSSFCLTLNGSVGAEPCFSALAEKLTSLCPDLKRGAAPYQLYFCSNLHETQLSSLAQDGIAAFLGCYDRDHSLAAAVQAWKSYGETGRDPILRREKVFAFCKEQGLAFTPLLTVSDGVSVIFAAKSEEALKSLTLQPEDRLTAALKKLDFVSAKIIDPKEVVASSWVKDHCRFGCSSFSSKHCPPFSPNYDETQTRLSEYKRALLLQGQPPTHSFQRLMLRAEKIAFKSGFYRAFAYWAGPCSICNECDPPAPPKKCTATRPSMESAGIDVFATVRAQGYALETRKDKNEFVKYFGLLLLD